MWMFQSQHAILMNKSWLHRKGRGGACAPEIAISQPVNHRRNDTEITECPGAISQPAGNSASHPDRLKPPINEQLMTAALRKEADSIYNNICRQFYKMRMPRYAFLTKLR